jgi:acyl-CoA synthetase (AMP-forming)/AMP-acid ligase II/acyl carrier protein
MMGLPLAVLTDDVHKDARKFAAAVREFGITTATVVPAFLEQLLDTGASESSNLKSLRTVAVGSAPLSSELVRKFKTLLPYAKLINAYGGTEAGSVARGEVTDREGPITIGTPVPNAEIYILNENSIRVPEGEVGELCVGGPSIAREYWQQPELTCQKFIKHPFSDIEGAKLYRTGDRGRYLPDGRIELAGRADRQVKVRGYRVELGEVEAILAEHPSIKEATVLSQPIENDHRLTAYICSQGDGELNVSIVREYLRARVPDYMLPSSYCFLAELPRTAIGKIDTSALPSPGSSRPNLDNPYVSPRTSREDMIVSIWAEILEVDAVGIHDHFLDLGGDSLLAVRIMAVIADRLGMELGAESLFEQPTVAELATAFDNQGIHASV